MSFLDKITGGGTQKTKSSPWKPQQGYLEKLFQRGDDLYNGGVGNPNINQGYQGLIDYSQGQGMNLADVFNQQGMQQAAGMGDAMSYYQNMMQGGAQGQANQLNDFISSRMDDPNLQSSIDAATRDTYRNLDENIHTGISAGAAGSGNTGSSRRYGGHAIAERGAADRAGDISANMRSNAYNQAASQGMQAMNMQNQNANQLMQGGMNGMNMLNQGHNMTQGMYGNIINAGKGMQQNPWDMLANYQGAVSGNYGGTTSQTNNGNILGAAGGLMTGMGGMATGFGWGA